MDKLTEIMAWKRREIAPLVRPVPLGELAALNARLPAPPSFAAALRRADGKTAVIAEIKRRSPSAGVIAETASAPAQARRYQSAASALSVLTDRKFFGGTLDDLRAVAAALHESAGEIPNPKKIPNPESQLQKKSQIPDSKFQPQGTLRAGDSLEAGIGGVRRQAAVPPIIRKDFMVHPVQVAEAREAGAAAILVIVRALADDEIKALHDAARAAGLDALFEIHHEDELARAVRHGARIIGVNNRDLSVFKTDLAFSERLIPQFPRDVIAVSESGIFTAADAARARAAGAHAVLVGEALMRAPDPAALIRELNG